MLFRSLPFLNIDIDEICEYWFTLTDIPYLDDEKLSMKTFFLVVLINVIVLQIQEYNFMIYLANERPCKHRSVEEYDFKNCMNIFWYKL